MALTYLRIDSMNTIEIKKGTISDTDQLQKIGRQTFFESFSSGNTEENMRKYLDEGFSFGKLTAELSDKNSEFYFATLDNKVVGYLKINLGPAQTELKDSNSLEIERIYVLKSYFGKKVGQLLYEKAASIAKELKLKYIWLGVWEKNERALQFYKKNGFVEFDQHQFVLGEDVQNDILMKLTL